MSSNIRFFPSHLLLFVLFFKSSCKETILENIKKITKHSNIKFKSKNHKIMKSNLIKVKFRLNKCIPYLQNIYTMFSYHTQAILKIPKLRKTFP